MVLHDGDKRVCGVFPSSIHDGEFILSLKTQDVDDMPHIVKYEAGDSSVMACM